MRLLLDTHICFVLHREREKLTSEIHRIIADPGNALWLSPVGVPEIARRPEKEPR
jgi:PIN domain nuclease of toxin-antitoxin system